MDLPTRFGKEPQNIGALRGFRMMTGAETFAALRSILSTARKHGWNILKTLAEPPETLVPAILA